MEDVVGLYTWKIWTFLACPERMLRLGTNGEENQCGTVAQPMGEGGGRPRDPSNFFIELLEETVSTTDIFTVPIYNFSDYPPQALPAVGLWSLGLQPFRPMCAPPENLAWLCYQLGNQLTQIYLAMAVKTVYVFAYGFKFFCICMHWSEFKPRHVAFVVPGTTN